jgi:hypothetical protein
LPNLLTQPATVATEQAQPRRFRRELIIRVLLVAAAVGTCYCFKWQWLRYLTSEANIRIDALAGMHQVRVSIDTVWWNGIYYYYANACTFADVWCGAVPLVWDIRKRLIRNLALIAGLAVALFVFNVLRLSASDILFGAGVPWPLAHHVVGGLSYFVVWIWVWDHSPLKEAWARDYTKSGQT